ncbi:hypothetical protein V6767_20110 [Martelella sp. FLE1502]
MLYHPDHAAMGQVVQNEDEELALLEEWHGEARDENADDQPDDADVSEVGNDDAEDDAEAGEGDSDDAEPADSNESEAGDSEDDAKAEMKAARDLYVETFGKRPGPKWTLEQINEKIAEAGEGE